MTDSKTTRLFHLALDVEMDAGAIAPTWEQAMTALEEMLDRAARDPQALMAALEVVPDEDQPRWVLASATRPGEILRQGRWIAVAAADIERTDLFSASQARVHEPLGEAETWRLARVLDIPPLHAVMRSTDDRLSRRVDITPWLLQADNADIRALETEGWENGSTSDEIAVVMKDMGDPGASEILDYIAWTVGNLPDVFCTVHVDEENARAWLGAHRPGVLEEANDLEA